MLGLVHRDIKPANVMVSEDFSSVKLMDLGVMRPIDAAASNVTDETARPFIGTLRYRSPEFLMREEENSPEGWRAITFYQLGGVLHDMIMRRELFSEFSEPFARLVKAVQEQIPTIDAPDVHTDLFLLARNCLVKDPTTRLKCVQWAHFQPPDFSALSAAEAARERVKRRRLLSSQVCPSSLSSEQSVRRVEQVRGAALEALTSAVRETLEVDELPLFYIVNRESGSPQAAGFVLRFDPSPAHGFYVPPLPTRAPAWWVSMHSN
jgi:serine/threonine protein kinase